MCLKVKFMKSVPGTALVEMGDEYAVDRAITHLNSIKVFGKRLNVWWEVNSASRLLLPLTSTTASLTCAPCAPCAVCPSSTPSSPARCSSWRTAAAATRTLPWPGTTALAAPGRPPKTSSSPRQQCCTTTMFLHVCPKTIYSGWGHSFWWTGGLKCFLGHLKIKKRKKQSATHWICTWYPHWLTSVTKSRQWLVSGSEMTSSYSRSVHNDI